MAKVYNKKSKEDKEREVNELLEKANKGIENCFNSPEQIKELANYMWKFYNYSFRNTFLIQNQFVGAIAVGSYGFWKEKGFTVNKGEKGIKILVPNRLSDYFINAEGKEVKLNKATIEEKKLIEQGKIEVKKGKLLFNQGYVFDVSQTNAKAEDLPKIFPNRWLEGEVQNYDLMYKAMGNIAKKIGVKIIEPKSELGAAKGVSYPLTKEVALNTRNTQLQNVKTLIHELAHAKLHTIETRDKYTSNAKEFQAELTAYTVCKYFGLDTAEYSFRYISSWTKDVELKDKENLLNEVRETVKEYIEVIEDTLTKNNELEVEKINENIKENSNVVEYDEELYKVMEKDEINLDEAPIIDRNKEYITLIDLAFEDGSFIKKGTSFLVEGFENGKYELHFENREDNKYIPNAGVGDGYYLTIDEIEKISDFSMVVNLDLESDDWKLSEKELADVEFKVMKSNIEELMQNNYENFIKAVISIEKNIDDLELLDKAYVDYIENDYNLLNNEIDKSIEFETKDFDMNIKRSVEVVYSELSNFVEGEKLTFTETLERFKEDVENGSIDKAVEFTFSLNENIKYNEEFIIDNGTSIDLIEFMDEKIGDNIYLKELVENYLESNGYEFEVKNIEREVEKDKIKPYEMELE
ncbi:ImmA/IrrE family metallo-endopeptidase [Clostridium culturomicium]|uniref:ImmA/IrrE family metallo-endopeptidase n=1 Tax=Clostridium culturomicium TaxID=1499683 RepID=UPI003857D085